MSYRHRWWASAGLAGGRLVASQCLSSPAPIPTESPEDRLPVTLLTLAGLVFMEAGHGLICSHSTIKRPRWLGLLE